MLVFLCLVFHNMNTPDANFSRHGPTPAPPRRHRRAAARARCARPTRHRHTPRASLDRGRCAGWTQAPLLNSLTKLVLILGPHPRRYTVNTTVKNGSHKL